MPYRDTILKASRHSHTTCTLYCAMVLSWLNTPLPRLSYVNNYCYAEFAVALRNVADIFIDRVMISNDNVSDVFYSAKAIVCI